MQEIPAETPQTCAHAEEMVAYLYSEASDTEARAFEAHMEHCESCRTELAAFAQVRGSIDEWRQQSLGSLGSLAPAVDTSVAPTQPRNRSALAALREFFTLSPVWLRAATAVVSVCACALVILAVARAEVRWNADGLSLRTGVSGERVVERIRTVEVEKPVKVGYSKEEMEQIVAERIRQERESFEARQPAREAQVIIPTSTRPRPAVARNAPQPSSINPSRQTVAEANRMDEEDLPRLYDLLGETN